MIQLVLFTERRLGYRFDQTSLNCRYITCIIVLAEGRWLYGTSNLIHGLSLILLKVCLRRSIGYWIICASPAFSFQHKCRLGENRLVGLNWGRALVLCRLRFIFNYRGMFLSLNRNLDVRFLVN